MKVSELIKKEGIEHILKKCNFNLKYVRTFLKLECQLPQNADLTIVMRKFKNALSQKTTSNQQILLSEINQKL
ncbi:MAG: hypothetical protein KH321_05700 [Clostridium sp.]|nr:hypothetical protein [Clostridium sp.]